MMWKPSQDVKSGVGPDDSKYHDRPTQRRRWDAISNPKLLSSHFKYSLPESLRWDASTQVPFESMLQQCFVACSEYYSSSLSRPQWDVSTQVPSEPKLRSSHIMEYGPLQPSRIVGGNECKRCPCCPPTERPIESCLPGLHQKYVDIYDSKKCIEGHLPIGYRSFVEHDDLYLPPSRPLSPASTDHDDLYLPLKTCDEYLPRYPYPCDLQICHTDPNYRDIYLPPSRPSIPALPKDPCAYPLPCPPLCNPCNLVPPPPCKPCPPLPCKSYPPPSCKFCLQSSCPPTSQSNSYGTKIQCSCSPYIKKLAPSPAPLSNDCSCPLYIKKLPGSSSSPSCSPPLSPSFSSNCSRSYPVQQCSSVYIDEVLSPLMGNRYIACQECLCHNDVSTQSLCPLPKKLSPPCRDCVCHLGARSPSQGGIGCLSKDTHTRCQTGFQTPSKSRLKFHLNQSQCLECKSPYSCKGPSTCNPKYIIETPLSPISTKSRSPLLSLRSKSPIRSSNCSTTLPIMSSGYQSCNFHKSQENYSRPSKVSSKLFEDPCCSLCTLVTPCRPLLAAEMLSGMEACSNQRKASNKSPSSCTDPRCATCECHKPKFPPSPPSCRPALFSLPCSPCSSQLPPNSSCRLPPPSCSPRRRTRPSCSPRRPTRSSCSPRRPTRPSCSNFNDDIHNPNFKNFQSTSPRCKDCDCHKPKNCKLSTQICKFCRGGGWCNCEYHTTQQLQTDCCEQSTLQHDNCLEVKEPVVSKVSNVSPENTYQMESEFLAKNSKVDFDSLCNDNTDPLSRILNKDMELQSDITQFCCCGKCEYTKPRFPKRTECPFCKHTHSCCCGMCSCPIPSCSSKTPLVFDGPTPRLSFNSNGASTGQSNYLFPYRPKSRTQTSKKKLGFTSPEKYSPKLFSTSNSYLSSARLCYSNPKTRMKSSVQQSPARR